MEPNSNMEILSRAAKLSVTSGLTIDEAVAKIKGEIHNEAPDYTQDLPQATAPVVPFSDPTYGGFEAPAWTVDDATTAMTIVGRGIGGAAARLLESASALGSTIRDFGETPANDSLTQFLMEKDPSKLEPAGASPELLEKVHSIGGLFPLETPLNQMSPLRRLGEELVPQAVVTAAAWHLIGLSGATNFGVGKAAELLGLTSKIGISSIVGSTLAGGEGLATSVPAAGIDKLREYFGGRELTNEERYAVKLMDGFSKLSPTQKVFARAFDDLAFSGTIGMLMEVPGKFLKLLSAGDRVAVAAVSKVAESSKAIDIIAEASKHMNAQVTEAVAAVSAKANHEITTEAARRLGAGASVSSNAKGQWRVALKLPNGSEVKQVLNSADELEDFVLKNQPPVAKVDLPEFPPEVQAEVIPDWLKPMAETMGTSQSLVRKGDAWVATIKTDGGARVTFEVTPDNVENAVGKWMKPKDAPVVEGTTAVTVESPSQSTEYARDIIDQVDFDGNAFSVGKNGDIRFTYTATSGSRVAMLVSNTNESIEAAQQLLKDNPPRPPKPKSSTTAVTAEEAVEETATDVSVEAAEEAAEAEVITEAVAKSASVDIREAIPSPMDVRNAHVAAKNDPEFRLKIPMFNKETGKQELTVVAANDASGDVANFVLAARTMKRLKLNENGLREYILDSISEHYGLGKSGVELVNEVTEWFTKNAVADDVGNFTLRPGAKLLDVVPAGTPVKAPVLSRSGSSINPGDFFYIAAKAATEQPFLTNAVVLAADTMISGFTGRDKNMLGPEAHLAIFLSSTLGKYARYTMNTGMQKFAPDTARELAVALAEGKTTIAGLMAATSKTGEGAKVFNLVKDTLDNSLGLPAQHVGAVLQNIGKLRISSIPGINKAAIVDTRRAADGIIKPAADLLTGHSRGFSNDVGFHRVFSELFNEIKGRLPGNQVFTNAAVNESIARGGKLFGGATRFLNRYGLSVDPKNVQSAIAAAELMLDKSRADLVASMRNGVNEDIPEAILNYEALRQHLRNGTVDAQVSHMQDMAFILKGSPVGTLDQMSKTFGTGGRLANDVGNAKAYGKLMIDAGATDEAVDKFAAVVTKHITAGEVISRGVFNSLLSGITTLVESAVGNIAGQGMLLTSKALEIGGNTAVGNVWEAMANASFFESYFSSFGSSMSTGLKRISGVSGVLPDAAARAGVYHGAKRSISAGFGLGNEGLQVIDKAFEFLGLGGPSHVMQAVDDIVVNMAASGRLAELTVRKAMELKSNGAAESMEMLIDYVKNDPKMQNELASKAWSFGRSYTGQETGGWLKGGAKDVAGMATESMVKFHKDVALLSWQLPFLGTGLNLSHAGMHHSVIGLIIDATAQGSRSILRTGSPAERVELLGRIAAGTMVTMGIYAFGRSVGARYISGLPGADQDIKSMGGRGGGWKTKDGKLLSFSQMDFFEVNQELLRGFDYMLGLSSTAGDLNHEEGAILSVMSDMLLRAAGGINSEQVERVIKSIGPNGSLEDVMSNIGGLLARAAVPNGWVQMTDLAEGMLKRRMSIGGEPVKVTPGYPFALMEKHTPTNKGVLLMAEHGIDVYKDTKDVLESEGVPLPADLQERIRNHIGSSLGRLAKGMEDRVKQLNKSNEDPRAFLRGTYNKAVTDAYARYGGEITAHVLAYRKFKEIPNVKNPGR